MLKEGDIVRLKLFGRPWQVKIVGDYYVSLYYKGKYIIVDRELIKYKKVKGKFKSLRGLLWTRKSDI